MTRALDPEAVDAIWAAIEPIRPRPDDSHPLGCHNPKVPDKVCFRGILIRLVTGSSWVDIEAIMNFEVSDTTLRARRDEWINAGVFDYSPKRQWVAMTASSSSTSTSWPSMGNSTRLPAVAKEPERAQWTGPSSAGNGQSPLMGRASRSGGPSTA